MVQFNRFKRIKNHLGTDGPTDRPTRSIIELPVAAKNGDFSLFFYFASDWPNFWEILAN